MNLAVIIPSYNTADLTVRCVSSIRALVGPSCDVLVVDNGSSDDSVARLRELQQSRVVALGRNSGFAGAINTGMENMAADFALWLNSDAFLEDAALDMIEQCFAAHPRMAACTPFLVNEDGSDQGSIHPFPTVQHNLSLLRASVGGKKAEAGIATDGVTLRADSFASGTALVVRTEAWNEVGPLDPAFFFYYEEADWQWRARAAGWTLGLCRDARTVHLRGVSGQSDRLRFTLLAYEGRDRFVRKHQGRLALAASRVVQLPGLLRGSVHALAGLLSPRRRSEGRFVARVCAGRLRMLLTPVPARAIDA